MIGVSRIRHHGRLLCLVIPLRFQMFTVQSDTFTTALYLWNSQFKNKKHHIFVS